MKSVPSPVENLEPAGERKSPDTNSSCEVTEEMESNHVPPEVEETYVSTKFCNIPLYKGNPGYVSSTVGLHGTVGVLTSVVCVRTCLGAGPSIAYVFTCNNDTS